jgi:flagellum-specific ATP synthase
VIISPIVYDALRQSPKDPPSAAALEELAQKIKSSAKGLN